MSGTRYSDCPRCEGLAKKFDERVQGFLKSYYGKISPDEYELLRKRLKKYDNPFANFQACVRLDYEAYVRGNTLHFEASAHCDVCGFEAHMEDETEGKHQSKSQEIFETKVTLIQDWLNLPRPV